MPAQYYGVTAFSQRAVQKGGRQLMRMDYYIASGPCATTDEAEQQAIASFGSDVKSMLWNTQYKNLRVVSKSALRDYGISVGR